MSRPSEAALAKRVVHMLKKEGWTIYKEVLCPNQSHVADIYAVKKRGNQEVTWAIEVKAAFGLAVMEQAYYWRRYADYCSIAVPRPKKRRTRSFGYRVCQMLDVGVVEIGKRLAKEHLRPTRNRNTTRPRLVEEQKTSTAGSPGGGHWTPFKETCSKLRDCVEQNEGVSLKDAIKKIDHHYKHERSAFSSLKKHLKKGVVDGVCVRWRRGVPHLFLK